MSQDTDVYTDEKVTVQGGVHSQSIVNCLGHTPRCIYKQFWSGKGRLLTDFVQHATTGCLILLTSCCTCSATLGPCCVWFQQNSKQANVRSCACSTAWQGYSVQLGAVAEQLNVFSIVEMPHRQSTYDGKCVLLRIAFECQAYMWTQLLLSFRSICIMTMHSHKPDTTKQPNVQMIVECVCAMLWCRPE